MRLIVNRPTGGTVSSDLAGRGGRVGQLKGDGFSLAMYLAAVVMPVLLLTVVTASCTQASSPNQVTVTLDSDGIPHIKADNFTALGYGEAWAFSQDAFCTLANDFVTVEGERSRYFGPTARSLNYSAGVNNTNLDSDLYWQSIKSSGIANREMHQAPPNGPLPQILQVYRGFVEGYNAYLASGKLNDPRCAGKPWVRPINLTDMFLRGYQIVTEASGEQFIADEVSAAPPAAQPAAPPATQPAKQPATQPATPAATKPDAASTSVPSRRASRTSLASARADVTTSWPGVTSAWAGNPDLAALPAVFSEGRSGNATLGSNGIAIGSRDSANGNGIVLANPHFPWRGTERFWMAQLTVPGQYNVEGGTLEGFPLIGIGFNQNIAWTHTVSTDFRFTFYQLKLVPGDPTSYYVDGRSHKMGTETVRVNTGHGVVTHTFYTTRWGRVVVVPQADYHWTATTAYAFDDSTINDAFRAANQYLRMGQATSVKDLLKVESTYLAIPTFNTIAADNTGHVLYADVGNTPAVPTSLIAACTPKGMPELVYAAAGVITLDGSRSACAWRDEPGTPVAGIFSAKQLPHTIRTDYVENSNDSYWLANPKAPFPAYSPIIGKIDTTQDLRTRLGNRMIAARVAGNDGLGPPGFTIATMQQMWESDRSELAKLVLKPLVRDCTNNPIAHASTGTTVDLTAACHALAGYNGTGRLNAAGGWLFSEWAVRAPSTNFWAVPFNPVHPLATPAGLNTSNPAILQALADAVLSLQAHHVPLDASYRQVQYEARNGVKVPIPGCDSGCFNAIYAADGRGGLLHADPYGEVYFGSSLVMTTELTAHGPISQGILTYSQATNPRSPYYANMTRLYSRKQWVSLPYTPTQLAHDRAARTFTLSVR